MTVREYLDKARKAGERLTPVGHGKPYAEAIAETMDVMEQRRRLWLRNRGDETRRMSAGYSNPT